MNAQIEEMKGAVRAFLHNQGQLIPTKTATSQREHLEVWTIGGRRRAAGFEFDHDGVLNIWVTALNRPPSLPAEVGVMQKTPKGRIWTDANGDGANSNLSAYDEFRTKPLVRMGVSNISDAMLILDHLNR